MKNYYLQLNASSGKVDVFSRATNSLISSVEVIGNGLHPADLFKIASALGISDSEQIDELEFDIYYCKVSEEESPH